MSEVPKLQRFNEKTCPPKWPMCFYIVLTKWFFSGSPKGTPHDWCRRIMKKYYFAMKTNGIRWCSSKKNEFFNITEGYAPRPVTYTHFFNAKRVFACILFCSWPCSSFSFDACAFVGTMIALNLAIVIQNLPKTQKMFNLLGFTHVFDMGISLFLWYLLWHCLCTPKFYPKYFYPKYSKFVFFCPHP